MSDRGRELLRHTVATVAYRAAKALRDAPEGFGGTRVGPSTRMPLEILTHIGDLFDWALSVAKGEETWHDSSPLPWPKEVDRVFATLRAFDDFLASGAPLSSNFETLFQGPVADALTHIGQITMLRRLANAPVKGENYSRAEILTGRVGSEQSSPRREFK